MNCEHTPVTFLSLCSDLYLAIYQLYRYKPSLQQHHEEKTDDDDNSQEVLARRQQEGVKYFLLILGVVKALADVGVYSNGKGVDAAKILFGRKLSDKWIGLLGVVSALVGIAKAWPTKAKPKKA